MSPSPIRRFFFPTFNKRYLLRLISLGAACYIIFTYVLIPLRIQGMSMEPTYRNGSFAFCWRFQYLFSPPKRSDVVTVRFTGRRVMLLKRIVAVAGDRVEFQNGLLYVNGKVAHEPYVQYRANWELSTRTISPGHVYVVGDNRGTTMARHQFGEVSINRIIGGVYP